MDNDLLSEDELFDNEAPSPIHHSNGSVAIGTNTHQPQQPYFASPNG